MGDVGFGSRLRSRQWKLPVAVAYVSRLGACLALLSAIPAPAADFTSAEILAVGQVVERLGTLASFNPAHCLGADGRVGTAVVGVGGQRALACGDASGFTAIVREGDPSPRGGVFVDFPDCALPANGAVYFAATRVFPPQGRLAQDVYRATPDGIEWIVGAGAIATDGTPLQLLAALNGSNVRGAPFLEVNDRGTVLVRAMTANGLVLARVRDHGPPEALRASYGGGQPWIWGNRDDAGLAGDDTVLALATLTSNEPAVVALDVEQVRVLFTMADVGLIDAFFPELYSLAVRGARFGFNVWSYNAARTEESHRYMLYSPERGFAPIIDPATYDAVFVLDFTAGGRALIAGNNYDQPGGDFTDYVVVDDSGVRLLGRDRSIPYAFPLALALNDRGNILLQTRMMPDSDVRQSLTLTGPPPEPRCFVPPTAVPQASATHTPTPTPIDCVATTDDPRCVRLAVGSATGEPGQRIAIDVRLHTGANEVAGIQNDLHVVATAPFDATDAGQPACRVSPAIHKDDTGSNFLPEGCDAGDDCERLRIVVLAFDNVDPIPDGSILYTCDLTIAADAAPGHYPIAVSETGFSDPHGSTLPGAASPGAVEVLASGDAAAVVRSATGGGDGCQIGATNTVGVWPAMLLAVSAMIWNRRR